MPYFLRLCILTSLFWLNACASHPEDNHFQPTGAELAFTSRMVNNYGFSEEQILSTLQQAKIQPSIITAISKPHEAKPWADYRRTFITPLRIQAGKMFMQAHAASLQKAEEKYGVSANVITAILGVETFYGRNQGNYRVLDALSTLAFYYPPRADFFQNELANYLILARDQHWNITDLKGSYAGASGATQFMPSAYLRYAVSASGSTSYNLSTNYDDAIFSVANYLKHNGWQTHAPIASKAYVNNAHLTQLPLNKLRPQLTIAEWNQHKVYSYAALPKTSKASLLVLQGAQGAEYWLGMQNFYAISSYNPRINYTMAVFQLSEALAEH